MLSRESMSSIKSIRKQENAIPRSRSWKNKIKDLENKSIDLENKQFEFNAHYESFKMNYQIHMRTSSGIKERVEELEELREKDETNLSKLNNFIAGYNKSLNIIFRIPIIL